jgi:DNA adenine methylase
VNRQPQPFLKWAGGKKQLLPEFAQRFPPGLSDGSITRYVEPFVGGGAVFFHAAGRYRFDECHIFDANKDLILAYRAVREDTGGLIDLLREVESAYLRSSEAEREAWYYEVRDRFNRGTGTATERAADLIFLNRTCYNGLYRVNSRGGFNVPWGRYAHPRILQEERLRTAAGLLEHTRIHHGDFSECEAYVDERTFVYFDPPYRPINRTSSFNHYASGGFSDADQVRLAALFLALHKKGARIMLSNSDPKNEDPDDHFFESMYGDFIIERVPARRAINSNGLLRGRINELIVRNYS